MKREASLLLAWSLSGLNVFALSSLITFDSIPNPFPYNEVIPNGYAGFQWQNFGVLDAADSGPGWDQTGYYYGTISPKNVAFNESAETASFSITSGTFDLNSAYLTAAYYEGLTFTAVGYRNGVALYNNTYTLSETTPTLIQFNYLGVDMVSMSSSPNQFAMDNLLVTIPSSVPEPHLALLSLVGAVLLGFAFRKSLLPRPLFRGQVNLS